MSGPGAPMAIDISRSDKCAARGSGRAKETTMKVATKLRAGNDGSRAKDDGKINVV